MPVIIDQDKPLWCVYILTSPEGKKYVGACKDLKSRWSKHGRAYKGSTLIYEAIQRFGWENFNREVYQSGLTRRQASQKERELVLALRTNEKEYGYNLTNGGFDGVRTLESLNKTRQILMGHPVSDSVRSALRKARSIPIICLETKEVFENSLEAGRKMNICSTSIGKNCNDRASNAGGFHFAKLSDYENGTIPQFQFTDKGKRVICLETMKIFETQTDAAKSYGVSCQAISHCCTGKVETCAKKHWKFLKEFEEDERRNKADSF